MSLIANANFEKAKILFTDGHTEEGFIKSFIESKIIDFDIIASLEHELNLDDKTIKFKTTQEGEVRTIGSDQIDEVTLIYDDGTFTTFKHILLKGIDREGNVQKEGKMVFLPYVKKGAINIFGIKYVEAGGTVSGPMYSRDMRFYYQNAKENYAINYWDFGLVSLFSIKKRTINPFKDLFKDCPALMAKLEQASIDGEGFRTMDKESKEKYKAFKKLDKKDRENLSIYHHYNSYSFERMFKEYEECK